MSDAETPYTADELAALADPAREAALIATLPTVTDPYAAAADPHAPSFYGGVSDGMGGFSDKLVAELQAEVREWWRQVHTDHHLMLMLTDPDLTKGKHVRRWIRMHAAAAQNPALIRQPDAWRLLRKQLAYHPGDVMGHVINWGKISRSLLTGYCWVDEEVSGDWRLRPSRTITGALEDSVDQVYDWLGLLI